MARKKRDESLPIAIATQGGLFAAMAVLLVGMMHGARAWILLMKAGTAFLLASGLLKLLSAGVMQGVLMKADKPVKNTRSDDDRSDDDLDDAAGPVPPASLERPEKVAS